MKKLSLVAGFLVFMFLAAPHTAEARGRFVISVGIGAPAYAPYCAPCPAYYYPPYSAYYAPYYYYRGPVVTYYRGYYGPRVYRGGPRYGHYRGHVPPGHAYGRYVPRRFRR